METRRRMTAETEERTERTENTGISLGLIIGIVIGIPIVVLLLATAGPALWKGLKTISVYIFPNAGAVLFELYLLGVGILIGCAIGNKKR